MRTSVSLLAGLCILLCSITSFAQTATENESATPPSSGQRARSVFGVRIGIMSSSDITLKLDNWDDQFTVESGFSGGVQLELASSRATTFAFALDLHKVSPQYVSDSKTMLELGLQFKSSLRGTHKSIFIRPFVGAGFGLLPEISFLEASHFLILKGGLELDFFGGTTGPGGMLEVGILGSPYGKSEDYTLTAAPRPFIRVGFLFR